MGWTVLYIAFGVVALWLLGEVLLQYKARLRWRLVAFCGFLGVVVGVLLPSVPVIAAGTVAFAIGQTFVTLSFRRGFSTGWALGGKPGTSKRRREGQGGEMRPLEPLGDDPAADDTGYDAYPPPPPPPAPEQQPGAAEEQPYGERQDGGYAEGYNESYAEDYTEEIHPDAQQPYEPAAAAAAPAADYGAGYGESYGDPGYPGQQNGDSYGTAYEPPYEPAYAAYTDPYLGGGSAPDAPGAAETYADYGAQPYQGDYPQDYQDGQQPYAPGYEGDYATGGGGGAWPGAETGAPAEPAYYQETPPGGVWMPQQRDPGEPDPAAPPYAPPEAYGQPEGEYYYGQFDQERRY